MLSVLLGEQEEVEKCLSQAGSSSHHYYTNESLSSVASEPEQLLERQQPVASSVLKGQQPVTSSVLEGILVWLCVLYDAEYGELLLLVIDQDTKF